MDPPFSTIPDIRGFFRKVIRVVIGRSRRFRICRTVLGRGNTNDIVVTRLDESTVSAWERYLNIPSGKIAQPIHGVYTHIAMCGDNIIGHVSIFQQWKNTAVDIEGWWLTGLEVNPLWRCAGLGRTLMISIISEWRRDHGHLPLFLIVRRNNRPACKLFESLGFKLLNKPEWEMRLRHAYPGSSHSGWNYQIMEYQIIHENSTDN